MTHAEHWLNSKRLAVYPRMILLAFVVTTLALVAISRNLVDPLGRPLGTDFISFWGASRLALDGHAEKAYDAAKLFAAQAMAVPTATSVYGWFYPPSFHLVVLPLALLPYLASYLAFMAATLAGYLAALRHIIRGREAMVCLAAFPGVWMNIFQGQNGFLTATLAGAALLCLGQRPILAGLLIGLLAIKPHLALLFPLALMAIGNWRAMASAGLMALALMIVGTATLGSAAFEAWIASLGNAWVLLKDSQQHWPKMPTVFASLRLLGVPPAGALAGHAVVATAAVAGVWLLWRRSASWPLRGAGLMAGTFLISPYLFDYDLAWLAFPIAWVALAGLRNEWLRGEREVLVAAWVLPAVMAPIALAVSVQIGPLVLGSLLWLILRRAGILAAGSPKHCEAGPRQFLDQPPGLPPCP